MNCLLGGNKMGGNKNRGKIALLVFQLDHTESQLQLQTYVSNLSFVSDFVVVGFCIEQIWSTMDLNIVLRKVKFEIEHIYKFSQISGSAPPMLDHLPTWEL